MKKIRLTEEQIEYCARKLAEQDEIKIDAQPDANGTISTQGLKTQYNNVKTKVGSNTAVSLSVNGEDLMEDEDIFPNDRKFTKKQLKEAKIRKMVSESKMYTKKDIANQHKK